MSTRQTVELNKYLFTERRARHPVARVFNPCKVLANEDEPSIPAHPARVKNPCHRVASEAGFASVMAVVMLGLAAVAMASLAALSSAEFRRTREAKVDAQLRQLLLAGAADVTAASREWGETPQASERTVAVPSTLISLDASLKTHIATGANAVEARIRATMEGRAQSQLLRFAKEDGHWRLVDVTLGF